MTTCLGKSGSFGLLCVSSENVYQFVRACVRACVRVCVCVCVCVCVSFFPFGL